MHLCLECGSDITKKTGMITEKVDAESERKVIHEVEIDGGYTACGGCISENLIMFDDLYIPDKEKIKKIKSKEGKKRLLYWYKYLKKEINENDAYMMDHLENLKAEVKQSIQEGEIELTEKEEQDLVLELL